MLVYVSLPFLVLSAFFFSSIYPRLSKVNCCLVFFYLAFFSGIRYGIGVDYFSYQRFIVDIAAGVDTYMESGFEFVAYHLMAAGGASQLVFLVFSFLTCLFYLISIIRWSSDKALSMVLFCFLPFFYLASFNQIRQFFVASLLAFSIGYIIERKLARYLILLVVAISFHKVAIVFLPMYWFANRIWSVKFYCFFFVVFAVLCGFIDFLALYIGVSSAYFVESVDSAFDFRVLIFLVLFVMAYIGLGRSKKSSLSVSGEMESGAVVVGLNMAFVCVLVMVSPIFITNVNAGELLRLSGLFSFCLLILIPFVLREFAGRYALIFSIGAVFVSMLYFILTIVVNGGRYKLVPYSGSLQFFG